jgi:hypothetical protein
MRFVNGVGQPQEVSNARKLTTAQIEDIVSIIQVELIDKPDVVLSPDNAKKRVAELVGHNLGEVLVAIPDADQLLPALGLPKPPKTTRGYIDSVLASLYDAIIPWLSPEDMAISHQLEYNRDRVLIVESKRLKECRKKYLSELLKKKKPIEKVIEKIGDEGKNEKDKEEKIEVLDLSGNSDSILSSSISPQPPASTSSPGVQGPTANDLAALYSLLPQSSPKKPNASPKKRLNSKSAPSRPPIVEGSANTPNTNHPDVPNPVNSTTRSSSLSFPTFNSGKDGNTSSSSDSDSSDSERERSVELKFSRRNRGKKKRKHISSSESSSEDDRDEFLTNTILEHSKFNVEGWAERRDWNQERNQRECLALAKAIDRLVKDHNLHKKDSVGLEMLVRRFVGVEAADRSDGCWSLCNALEYNNRQESLLPPEVLDAAMKRAATFEKVKAMGKKNKVGKSKKSNSSNRSYNRRKPVSSSSSSSTSASDPQRQRSRSSSPQRVSPPFVVPRRSSKNKGDRKGANNK